MTDVIATGTILDRILERTAAEVAARKERVPVATLERRAAERPAPIGFAPALSRHRLAVIAEVKRASPSRGRFPVEIDPAALAAEYVNGGAAAISVLTDEPFFQGSLADLDAAAIVSHAASEPVPVLRKDFVIDEYQVVEALAHGADAVLLIVAALEQSALTRLLAAARACGLGALVEAHDEVEVLRALDAGADVIGINNRDLRTFHVDLATTERLASLVPADRILVSESGIATGDDVQRLAKCGVRAILVGESLVVAPDRAAAIRAFTGAVA